MKNQENVIGMVLSAIPIGEYDRRLVILTKERGRISAFAKGARRPNSTLMACSQPFAFGQFQLYVGRNSYTVNGAEIQNYFQELRQDLEAVYYGMYFCEFSAYLTRENVESTGILKLLYQSLRALGKKNIPNQLIRYIFEIKILCFNGEAPQVFECLGCKEKEGLIYFNSHKGGMLCGKCKLPGSIKLDEAALYTLQYIISSSVEKLYTFLVKDTVLQQLQQVTESYRKTYVQTEMKTLEMLEFFAETKI